MMKLHKANVCLSSMKLNKCRYENLCLVYVSVCVKGNKLIFLLQENYIISLRGDSENEIKAEKGEFRVFSVIRNQSTSRKNLSDSDVKIRADQS